MLKNWDTPQITKNGVFFFWLIYWKINKKQINAPNNKNKITILESSKIYDTINYSLFIRY